MWPFKKTAETKMPVPTQPAGQPTSAQAFAAMVAYPVVEQMKSEGLVLLVQEVHAHEPAIH